MAGIIRVTLFKIPVKENQAKLLDLYRTLAASAKKVSLPLNSSFPNFFLEQQLIEVYRTANPTYCLSTLDKHTKINAAKVTRSPRSPSSAPWKI
jgi:hypothetical protein